MDEHKLKYGDIVLAWDNTLTMPHLVIFQEMDSFGRYVCTSTIDFNNPGAYYFHYENAQFCDVSLPDEFKNKLS